MNKLEFEEVFKKSTEKLIYEIPMKNKEGGYKEKFNLWKPNTGRQEITKMSKPPKYINPSAAAGGISKKPINNNTHDKGAYINHSSGSNKLKN